MAIKTVSPLDQYRSNIVEWVNQGKSDQWISEALTKAYRLGTTRHSIRRARLRWNLKKIEGVETPSFRLQGNDADITGKVSFDASTPDDLLRERGLQPDDWEIVNLVVNEWEALTAVDPDTGFNEVKVLRQLKIHCKRTTPVKFIVPARIPGAYIRKLPSERFEWENGKLIVFVGDQQIGGPENRKHDPRLHDLFLEWLDFNKPAKGIQLGDLIDNSEASKYMANPEWDEPIQQCIDNGYVNLMETVQASEETEWDFLLGNHDARLRLFILQHAPFLYNLRRAKGPNEEAENPVCGLRNLLRLDELGINLIDANGDYEFASAKISENLAARHGWKVKRGAGKSGTASIADFDYSLVIGHVHRQAITHRTVFGMDGSPRIISAMETGTMAKVDENGLGYSLGPDWQPGFGTATVWDDGTFQFQLASYKDGKLYWGNQRFS